MVRVLKFKSKNLFGETRKQEEKRLLDQRVKAIQKGKTANVRMDAGTTQTQKEARRKILNKSNLSTKVKKFNQVFRRVK